MPLFKPSLSLFATILFFCSAHSQEISPLITGNVDISITKGTIACDLVLTNLPVIKNYVIRLNSGMNIHYFKDVKRSSVPLYYDVDTKDSIQSDETKAYYLHENRGNPARYIPERLEVKYVGMYPIAADSASGYMGQDWRGNVAFNGYSLRADGFQAAWYPVIYDMVKRKRYSDVRYNIAVTCADCNVLFLNGSSPIRTQKAVFKSDDPRELSIFCGRFSALESNGVWLLNSDMQKADEQKLFDVAASYQAFYAKMLGIPFKGSLTYVQTTPVADPKNWAFSFYSAPTIFNVGVGPYGMQSLFDKDHGPREKQVMAHELAHFYFGTLLLPKGIFGSIIEEGFAEYLSYKLTRNLTPDSNYRALLKNKIKSLTYFHNYQPLSQVNTEADYGNREYYLYYYAPVLFIAIEKEIGEQDMLKWLKIMINSKAETTDYNFLLTAFREAVPDQQLSSRIEAKYFTSPDALKNALEEIKLQ